MIKLGDICGIWLEAWASTVEAFMLIIKGNYEEGVNTLTNLCNDIKRAEESKKLEKIKR